MNSKPEALVLVPGLMSDAGLWQAQINALQSRIPVTVIDHGELDSLSDMAGNVLEHAPAKFALAGHSMGGRVVLEVMRQDASRVTHLALLDTACHAITDPVAMTKERETRLGFLKIAREQGLDRMARIWVQNMVHPDRLQDEALLDSIARMFARQSVAKYAAQINALLNRTELFPALKTITCPTLVLCGREDASTTLAVHEEMMSALPNASLVVVEHCGHMSMLEQPDTVTAAMQRWLEK
ncbi:MAG TPA: alpha/beta hydrolase [Steroidobacteraceae bacterium]|nr:alpha/beta hydrolase [Steroidobacteraceae bacterium]